MSLYEFKPSKENIDENSIAVTQWLAFNTYSSFDDPVKILFH